MTAIPAAPPTVVCRLSDILPGAGVAALIAGRQVAVFRTVDDTVHCLDNRCPFSGAQILARGLLGEAGGRWYVASPMHKQRFDLLTGACLDDAGVAVTVHQVTLQGQEVLIALSP